MRLTHSGATVLKSDHLCVACETHDVTGFGMHADGLVCSTTNFCEIQAIIIITFDISVLRV